MKFQDFEWYDEPLFYDIVFDAETAGDATFLEDVLRRFGTSKRKRVLEPACGSGRLVAELAHRGYSVTGLDCNEHMLRFARDRLRSQGLRATLHRGWMQRFATRRRFDLAHCLVSSFKYLLDEDDAAGHLRCVAEALRPGGVYVLGLHLADYGADSCTRERWVVSRDDLEVTCNTQTWPADSRSRRQRLRCRLTVRGHGDVRRLETRWTFRTYDARQLLRLVAGEPRLEHVATFDFHHDVERSLDLDGDRLDVVLVLRRVAGETRAAGSRKRTRGSSR